jgi:hypothetical protein
MTQTLYEVRSKCYVLAENPWEAERFLAHLGGCTVSSCVAETVDTEWLDFQPFGRDATGKGRTCREIVEGRIAVIAE